MENFVVSARKYRPSTFDMVVGQNSITTTLKNAIRNDQLAQAFLFCGPRGVGKTTCARILAKTINCTNLTPDIEPCNECDACRSFNVSTSFNIHELDAASNNKVEDIRTLREILENLVRASFEQEDLMQRFSNIKKNDPRYVKMGQEQKNLKNSLQIIEDSLFALSKRQTAIESFVNREINQINQNAENVLVFIHDRNIPKITSGQQYIMTSVNNLALLLSEALQQMQEQMAQSSSSKSGASCNNPKAGGSGKKPSSAKTMRQMQEQLNKQMEEMKNSMQKGGKQQKAGQSMSEQFARMAAQQEAIRRMMQEYGEQIEQQGKGNTIGEMMKQMEQTENELVNKIISPETLKRQQEILTRLLESEKAEQQRELDQKRESNEAKNDIFSNPGKYFEYNTKKFKEAELLKTMPPSLKIFYKNKVSQYFLNVEE
jgi:hypothetical protein